MHAAGTTSRDRHYNRRMTTTIDAPSALANDLEGLTETDAARITAAIAANCAPTTLHAYAWAWSHFATGCRRPRPGPAARHPATVCANLTERADQASASAR